MDDEAVRSLALKVLDSFTYLKRVLAERGECEKDRIVIYDDPLIIEITPSKMTFFVDGEECGIISRDCFYLNDEVRCEAELWLQSLTSLRFKRYTLKKE